MYSDEIVLQNETGLHARPASIFVQEASKYISNINLIMKKQRYNAKSIMGLLSMGASKGDAFIIEAEGEDEKEAVNALINLLNKIGQ